MPPSGYSVDQADLIDEFLYSCARALETEARKNAVPLREALLKEINTISKYLGHSNPSQTQAAILKLNASFYTKVLADDPVSPESFWKAVTSVIKEIVTEIAELRIPIERSADRTRSIVNS
jgi:hypothetical protein